MSDYKSGFPELGGKAYGGPVLKQGIGSLHNTARNMFQGPRGIGVYQQFTGGGPVEIGGIRLSDYDANLIFGESSNRPGAVNKDTGAAGLPQAMPETYEEFKKATGSDVSFENYKKSPRVQMEFLNWYKNQTKRFIERNNLERFIGTKINGTPVTLSGMYAVAHLGGNVGLLKFLTTGGEYNPSDNKKNPQRGTYLSDYLAKFANLDVFSTENRSSPMVFSQAPLVNEDQAPPVLEEEILTDQAPPVLFSSKTVMEDTKPKNINRSDLSLAAPSQQRIINEMVIDEDKSAQEPLLTPSTRTSLYEKYSSKPLPSIFSQYSVS
tara:strand:+ start:10616 stop:11581 length:966 start_codon:yes stop_codon:yes gene_type:complete